MKPTELPAIDYEGFARELKDIRASVARELGKLEGEWLEKQAQLG